MYRGFVGSMFMALLIGSPAPRPKGVEAGSSQAEIVFLDVGQGDAIVIRDDTFAILVDAGSNGTVTSELRDLGIRHLNLAIASHNHRDHIGGMDEVIEAVPIDRFIENGCYGYSDTQDNVHNALRYRKVLADTARDTTFKFGAIAIQVIPSPFRISGCDSSQNNLSVGVLVQVGQFRALLTGDSEVDELNAWLRKGVIPDVDLLKAAHHGARDGVTPGWIQAAKPEVVVISVGKGNSYGHPAEAALRYYRSGRRTVMRTDQLGNVGVCIQGDGKYTVRASLGETPTCP
jgi:competence protein ComEC